MKVGDYVYIDDIRSVSVLEYKVGYIQKIVGGIGSYPEIEITSYRKDSTSVTTKIQLDEFSIVQIIDQTPLGSSYRTEEDFGSSPPEHDPINHPQHYITHPSGVECIQITEHMNFCLGNAIKYIWRADQKNGVEDLQKAVWYINREIEKRGKYAS